MKIEPRQAEAFLKKPDPRIRGVVIYGNDDGLVAERAVALAKSICDDLNDPFRVVDIAGEVLKHDPARLADEFGALSMMGGRRVIRVRPAGEESVAALENLVAAPAGDALIVVEGGNLTPRSGLRTLAETEACLAAMPCYMDNEAALEGLVESAARAQGLTVDADALPWIVERLGGDRGQTRSEIDKLLLYKASDPHKTVTLADAIDILGDTAAIGMIAPSTASSPRAAIRSSSCARCSAMPTSSISSLPTPARAATWKRRCSRPAACRAAGRCASASNAICAPGRCRASALP